MTAVWFRVTGRVQGVGFRAYTVHAAEELQIKGEVWNTREGAVEGHAQGDNVLQFLKALENGPGRVDAVVSEPTEPIDYKGFEIGRTR